MLRVLEQIEMVALEVREISINRGLIAPKIHEYNYVYGGNKNYVL
jgi:hypothetical protein